MSEREIKKILCGVAQPQQPAAVWACTMNPGMANVSNYCTK